MSVNDVARPALGSDQLLPPSGPWFDEPEYRVRLDDLADAIDHAIGLAASSSLTRDRAIASLGEGWVAEEALAIAIYCSLVAEDVRDGLVVAVNHSGDSDSTGAITGNILGALLGEEALPADLLAQVEGREVIEQLADDLATNDVLDRMRYPPN